MEKILIANRGEIAIRIIRACQELKLKTVAIFAKEDEFSVHRFKADEAYQVGAGKKPIEAYLDMDDIIRIAKMTGADAIHPGYGFLAENEVFAQKCAEAGINFIGPTVEQLDIFGDKIKAKLAAQKAGLHTIPGSNGPAKSLEDVKSFAAKHGYPIMVKAALGGGGRGMRIIENDSEIEESYNRARSEAKQSFGDDELYVEKYLKAPKHIEVQILADKHGNVLHLFERDCSVQRRHQKVIEVAPSISLAPKRRHEICQAAVQLMKSVSYQNAGTVEFLVTDDDFYFIEVNPRVQVEHTISEMITDVDIVQSQILVAAGKDLFKDLNLPHQAELKRHGVAIQCRVTTEDPENNFMPDTGKIETYRSPGGFGVRLDGGNAYAGAVITPYFDSLLVKACVQARNFVGAVLKMDRVLDEFRIRGVKTNIAFMRNVINNPVFLAGKASTTFIDSTPELFDIKRQKNTINQLLKYIGNVTVNGFPGTERHKKVFAPKISVGSDFVEEANVENAKKVLDRDGAEAMISWVKAQNKVLLTDTTMRDAHQSLFATRMRTKDMIPVANIYDKAMPHIFSTEVWGGATFDVAYRFLDEDPWERLKLIRQKMPHTLLQMLFRGSNAVGYKNYPDNVLQRFIEQSATDGVDVFRIFDSLNWVTQMEKSIQFVRDTGKIAEGTMCYTGDVLNPSEHKYDLEYYKRLAKDLVAAGSQIIGIKDMAGLLKPKAAYELISSLKDEVDVPIHLHTHDTTGNGVATYVEAVRGGVDVVDVATSALSGTTSQPSMSSLYYALTDNSRQPALNIDNVERINRYWQGVKPLYQDFMNGITAPQTDIYQTEMPGGQYSNLQQQAKALGINDFEVVKKTYREVNQLLGDIVKVTPSSKVVGDFAIFMIKNQLTPTDIFERGEQIDFPQSVVDFFAGDLGQPVGGFPKKLQEIVLKGKEAIKVRPGSLAQPVDFDKVADDLETKIKRKPTIEEVLSYVLYPDVFLDYEEMIEKFGELEILDTNTFYQGMRTEETLHIDYGVGKRAIVRLNSIGDADEEGNRNLYFTLNGQAQQIVVHDMSKKAKVKTVLKAEPTNPRHIGATLSGSVLNVLVTKNQIVKKGEPLIVTEAMKMETTIKAPFNGRISHVYAKAGDILETRDLLLEIEPIKE
ncbi:pyruvate carboxyl transferase [Liquorilactobacillus sucicola DSM 21376 = JCM 15457]|uniref:Pyruvate carboxylase n=1 Tax=Liquorilactobacillus sucicola DSM 21376 = JCM 15457 TaxID=1423806 RepID=A0A023CU50_9LACO|nr:pyruvate carboxylase [Liquorilactobacillus sucicola]KRN05285.1 pyruvate carboxylase [Liquorilactobacillus sucicola DSM 21376 = JCM 15457]GAJ25347.1 pyruvate carboxyl transferase [Liquorilactobacillus sucicola DSM 21376 = JCM 15457]